ncbi:MAG TPA: hypothetical protein VGM01_13760 [Ktedonobacteraceae bacterium]
MRTLLDRVLQEAQCVGRLSQNGGITQSYDLIFPEFDSEDSQEMGTAISYLMQGMTAAKGAGWISREQRQKPLLSFLFLH